MSDFQIVSSEASCFTQRSPATTFEFLEYQAGTNPERTALVLHNESFTFGQFHADVMRFSCALAELGVSRGQIVLVSHPHFYLHWLLLVACENLGVISASYRDSVWLESSRVLECAQFVIAEGDPPARASNAVFRKIDQDWLSRVLRRSLRDVRDHPRVVLGLNEAQRLTHSSGTTGGQKAMLLHRGAQEAKLRALWQSSDYSRDVRVLVTLPLTVNSAFLQANLCLRLGALVVVAPLVSAIRDHQITYFEVLPIMLEKMLRELPSDFVKPPMLNIKVIGAPLTKYLCELSLRSLCTEISGRYGTNEVWPISIDMNTDGVGTVLPGVDLMIVDDQGEKLPHGQVGHVAVRSATMVEGYFNDPEATGKHFQDGWFLTGDLGRLLSPRRLKLMGRSDDVLNQGGLKCYPYPIEERIRTINGVVEVAVTSVASDHAIDHLCVAIVLEDGVDCQVMLRQIVTTVADWPQVTVKVLPQLPKTSNGKLIRTAVRQLFKLPAGTPR